MSELKDQLRERIWTLFRNVDKRMKLTSRIFISRTLISKILTSRILTLFLVGFPWVLASPAMGSECESEFERESSEQRLLQEIERLNPYLLDYSNIKKSIEELIRSLPELSSPFQSLREYERLQYTQNLSPEVAYQLARALEAQALPRARELLSRSVSDPSNDQYRKQLEGYRILLNRLARMKERAIQQYRDAQDEKQSQKPTGEDAEGTSSEGSQKKQQQSDQTRYSKEELAQKVREQLQEKSGEPVDPDSIREMSEEDFKKALEDAAQEMRKSQEQKSDSESSPSKSESEQQVEQSIQDRMEELMQKMAQEQASREAKEQGDQSPSDGEGQDGEGQDGKGDESSQGSQEGPGEGGGEGEESPNGQGERREGKEGAEESYDEDSASVQDGSDGEREGGQSGEKELLQRNAEQLQDLIQEMDQEWKPEGHQKLSKEELEALRKQWIEEQRDSRRQEREREAKINGKGEPIAQDRLEKNLYQLWKWILAEYTHSEKLMRHLSDFAAICRNLSHTHKKSGFLRPFADRASSLYEKLKALEVSYGSLDELSYGLAQSDGRKKKRALRFLETILDEREREQLASDEETRTLSLLRRLLGELDRQQGSPQAKAIVDAFEEQLQGPLSRKALQQNYPSRRLGEEYDSEAIVRDLKNGMLGDLIAYNRLSQFVDILFNESLKPRYSERHTGDFESINEADAELKSLLDLDELPQAVREGNPTQLEILRLISNDLLMQAYRKKVKKPDPKKPFPKKASIVLFDISGSMTSMKKEVLRNALINAFIDRSQREVAQGLGEHVLYLIAFDGKPHEPRRISSLREAQQFFDEMRARPRGSGGDDSISAAMVKAYKLIAEHQAKGGELERGNILLITDAVARINFRELEEARAKVDPSVDLALHAITMGDLNKDVTEMIKRYALNGRGELGKVSHQHLTYDDLRNLLSLNESLSKLLESARDYMPQSGEAIRGRVTEELQKAIRRVGRQIEKQAQRISLQKNQWKKPFQSLEEREATRGLRREIEFFFERVVFTIGKEWSEVTRVQAFTDFLQHCEQVYGLDSGSVILSIPLSKRRQLREWL